MNKPQTYRVKCLNCQLTFGTVNEKDLYCGACTETRPENFQIEEDKGSLLYGPHILSKLDLDLSDHDKPRHAIINCDDIDDWVTVDLIYKHSLERWSLHRFNDGKLKPGELLSKSIDVFYMQKLKQLVESFGNYLDKL